MNSLTRGTRAVAALAFLLLAFSWIGLRFGPGRPDEATTRLALEAVRVVEVSGRFAARGVPTSEDFGGLFRGDASRAASAAFAARLDAVNLRLQRAAADAARHVADGEGGAARLTVGGMTARFFGAEADRLRTARDQAALRPLDALIGFESVLRARLEAAPVSLDLTDTTERRELTRFARNVEDDVAAAREQAQGAGLWFQRHAAPTVTGPDELFFRRGPARLLEALLAGLLGVTLGVARRGGSVVGGLVATAAGALGGVASVLALEGGPLLPVGPDGTAPAFVLIAFLVGTLAAALARSIGEPRTAPAARSVPGEAPSATPQPAATPPRRRPRPSRPAAPASDEPSDSDDIPSGPPAGPFPYEDIREIAREVLRNGRRRRSAPAAETTPDSSPATAPAGDATSGAGPRADSETPGHAPGASAPPDLGTALTAAADAVARLEAQRAKDEPREAERTPRSETEIEEDEGLRPLGPGRRGFGDPVDAAPPVPPPSTPPPEGELRERPLRASRPRPIPPSPESLPFFRKRRR